MSDWNLLRQYLDNSSETAFAQLVDRHMKLVYWTCRRDLSDPEMAEDATQVVFLLFARKASSLRRGTSIAGWLFNTARFVSKNAMAQEMRRRRREERAARSMEHDTDLTPEWTEVEPWINEGLAKLTASDREVVLLRYFQDLSIREVAVELGTTEPAARKRLSRATDKLRQFLHRKDVAVSSTVLAAMLCQQSAQAVPASTHAATLGAIQHAVLGHSSAAPISTGAALLQKGIYLTMEATKRKIALAAIGAVIVGAGVAVPVALKARQAGDPVGVAVVIDKTLDPGKQVINAEAGGPSVDPHTEIDGIYKRLTDVAASGKSPYNSVDYASDFNVVIPTGQRLTMAQLKPMTEKNLAAVKKMDVTFTISKFVVNGDTAVVTGIMHTQMLLRKAPQVPEGTTVTQDEGEEDYWTKQNGRWTISGAKIVSDSYKVDGKPAQSTTDLARNAQ